MSILHLADNQPLFSQVTVAHINATAKNAADDKLRQSLRRFAETHAAPATVVLVSCECSILLWSLIYYLNVVALWFILVIFKTWPVGTISPSI